MEIISMIFACLFDFKPFTSRYFWNFARTTS